MKVKYEVNLHIYDDQEPRITKAVELHNMSYKLKIIHHKKYTTRWYFTIEGELPSDLNSNELEKMKMDTCYRIGYFLAD